MYLLTLSICYLIFIYLTLGIWSEVSKACWRNNWQKNCIVHESHLSVKNRSWPNGHRYVFFINICSFFVIIIIIIEISSWLLLYLALPVTTPYCGPCGNCWGVVVSRINAIKILLAKKCCTDMLDLADISLSSFGAL